jgi:hypothetical protein
MILSLLTLWQQRLSESFSATRRLFFVNLENDKYLSGDIFDKKPHRLKKITWIRFTESVE